MNIITDTVNKKRNSYTLNRKEKQELVKRLSKGRIQNFKTLGKPGGKGKGVTGKAVFGYYWKSNILKIDPQKAEWIRRIFRMRANENSLGQIATYLDENGIRTTRGKKFSRQAISNILRNRFYIGEASYGEFVLVDHHDPIVPLRLFNLVNGA